MLTATSEFATAAAAASRRPVASATIAWEGDSITVSTVDDTLRDVEVTRSLATDLPEGVRPTTGVAAATATLLLGGTLGGVPVVELLSPLRAAGDHLYRRVQVAATVDVGFVTADGPELLRQFTGVVRRVRLDPVAGTALVELIDHRTRFAVQVTPPVVCANDSAIAAASQRPGLNGQWLADYVFRRCGYYASPPNRDEAVLSATMHGSTFPEVGQLDRSYDWFGSANRTSVRFVEGVFGLAMAPYESIPGRTSIARYKHAALSQESGTGIRIEGWFYIGEDSTEALYVGYRTSSPIDVRLLIQFTPGTPGQLEVQYTRDELDWDTAVGPQLSGPASWRYLAVHISHGSSTCDVRFRVDGATTLVTTGALPVMQGELTHAFVGGGVEALQVSQLPYSAGLVTGYEDHVSQVILDPSLNELTGIPFTDPVEAWGVLQALADAEQGTAGLTEDGVPFFRNRLATTTGAAGPAIDVDTNLLPGAASEESADTVRNVVQVPAAPLVPDREDVYIWSLAEPVHVPGRGRTVTIWASFEAPAWLVNTSMDLLSPEDTSVVSGFRANLSPDGSGANVVAGLSATMTVFPAGARIDVTSTPAAADTWIVNPDDLAEGAGQPSMWIAGRLLRPTNPDGSAAAYTATDTRPDSVTIYGEQLLQVPANPLRQSLQSATEMASALAGMLAEPLPSLTDVEVLGDPRRQLTDRLPVRIPQGLGVAAEYMIAGLRTHLSAAGLVQSLDLRKAVVTWVLDDDDLSILDATTVLG